MKEARGEMLGVAAIALVEPHDVLPAGEGLRGEAAHVVRVGGPIEAVQDEQRRMLPRTRLPVTHGEHAVVGVNVEIAGRRRGQAGKVPGLPQLKSVMRWPLRSEGRGTKGTRRRPFEVVYWPLRHRDNGEQ